MEVNRIGRGTHNPGIITWNRVVLTLAAAVLLVGGASVALPRLLTVSAALLPPAPEAAVFHLDLGANSVVMDTPGGPQPVPLAASARGRAPEAQRLGGGPARRVPRPRGLAGGDFGGLGVRAVAVADFSGDQVILLVPAPGGSFDLGSRVRVPAGPRGLLAADIDGDGRTDLAVASSVAQKITILLGRGSAALSESDSILVPGIPLAVAVEAASKGEGVSGRDPGVPALLVSLADGALLRYRSLGGGLFDHHPGRVGTGEEATDENGRRDPEESPGGDAREALLITTPPIDFGLLNTCVAGLAIPAKKIATATKRVMKAESIFTSAAAGTRTKKFAKSAAQLNGYISTINGQVGVTVDQPTADTCVVPAQEDVDAILLIGALASLSALGGDDQAARPFARLPLALQAGARDVYGNPVPKLSVAFSVLTGTATLGAASAVTDSQGIASTTLIFGGPPDGDVSVQASAGSVAPAAFTEHRVTGVISLATEVQPIFTANCVFAGCHAGPNPEENQNLSAGNLYNPTTGIVGVASHEAPPRLRVKPGESASSYIVNKIEGTQLSAGGSGVQMPKNRKPLPLVSRFLIEAWIDQGALNN